MLKEAIKRFSKLFRPDLVSWILLTVVFIVPSLFITFFLFGLPFKKVVIDTNNFQKNEYSISLKISDEFTRTFLAKIFQTSLSLDWYDICLVNQNEIFINDKPAILKDLLKQDPEAGAMELIISYSDNATSSLYTDLLEKSKECKTLDLKASPTIRLIELSRRSPEKFEADVRAVVSRGDVRLQGIAVMLSSEKSYAYFKNNLLAWILKFTVILGVVAALILFTKKLLTFVGGSETKE